MAQLEQNQAGIPKTGFVPYPILVNPATQAPILAPDGSYQPAWDGSLADLMAADAYANCVFSSSFASYGHLGIPDAPWNPERNDAYLQHLKSRMGQFQCGEEPFMGPAETVGKWIAERSSAQCNVDPRTGTLTSVVMTQRDPSYYASFHEVFEGGSWELALDPATDEFVFNSAHHTAALELEYADLNLCIAQRLRSQMNGGQSLFTASSDHTEILGLIRERTQLAIVYYSLLAKVLSAPGAVPTTLDAAEYEFPILIRHWAEWVDAGTLQTMGADFASAVRLHLETTYALANVFERQAAARTHGDLGLDRAERDWGPGQPRMRLMNLLYGGDPLGSPEFPYAPGRGVGGVARFGTVPAFVRTNMADPKLATLLGLARSADALFLRANPAGPGFVVAESAERLFRNVEATVRGEACELETPGDPSCDPETIVAVLPPVTEIEQYELWKRHGLEPGHASALTRAFNEAFGELALSNNGTGFYRADDGMMHLLGNHEITAIGGNPWFHIDPDFGTAPLSGHELMTDYVTPTFLPRIFVFGADARQQGFIYSAISVNDWERLRGLGAVAALTYAREAIVDGSTAPAFAVPFFEQAAGVLPDVERAAGKRSVILRPRKVVTGPVSCSSGVVAPGATCEVLIEASSGSGYEYEVDVVTRPDDPLDTLVLVPESRQLETVAMDALTRTIDGLDRAALDAYPGSSGTTQNLTGIAAGYQRRSYEYIRYDSPRNVVFLRGNDPLGAPGDRLYMPLHSHVFYGNQGYFTSFGGTLHGIGQRVTRVLSRDWSRPAFDAFGFPVDWVPPSDASLVGGAAGEPSYEYYLRSARSAAEEATQAVQKAMDNLVDETLYTVQREAAEQRAQGIAGIEHRTLCGERVGCQIPITTWRPAVPSCDPALSGIAAEVCSQAWAQLVWALLPNLALAQEVVDAGPLAPQSSDLAGSEVQRILIRQWTSKQVLERLAEQTMDVIHGVAREAYAAEQAVLAADVEWNAALADYNAEVAQLNMNNAEVQAAQAEVDAQILELEQLLGSATAVAMRECSPGAYAAAGRAGKGYSGEDTNVWVIDVEESTWTIKTDGQDRSHCSWSFGPVYAQLSRCNEARDQLALATFRAENGTRALTEKRNALLAHGPLDEQERVALVWRLAAAATRREAAIAATHAASSAAHAQIAASFTQVQQAVGEAIAASAELEQARLKAENAVAVAELDRDLVLREMDERFGLERKFRSYDMWRARALIEGARRMSVAARRAIEARFVVDLSDLQAPQAFVDSPAIWADEVYGSDLNAPAVVGLSAAPKLENAIYPNQLLDYVGNLERFVKGYTVTYPTSVAAPDTEIVTLPGPELTEELTRVVEVGEASEEQTVPILSGDALGWTFYCPSTNTWTQHPGVGQVPLVDRVASLCAGTPPTRMRYSFSLDPWARLDQSVANRPLAQRHNVRWRQLAVNLIGTGIRDCRSAANPEQCFSESFLRFQLTHSGPSWSMNHAQQWRAFDLPAAFIEDGKALTSEEWLDPIANSWSAPFVANVARGELFGRPVNGAYDLTIELSPDVRVDRIQQIQLLIETDYWVRQQ